MSKTRKQDLNAVADAAREAIWPPLPEVFSTNDTPTRREWFLAELRREQQSLQSEIEKWADRILGGSYKAQDGFEWGEGTGKAAAKLAYVYRVAAVVRGIEEEGASARKAISYLDEEAQRRMESGLSASSTSQMSNVAERYLGEAWTSWSGRYGTSFTTRKSFVEVYGPVADAEQYFIEARHPRSEDDADWKATSSAVYADLAEAESECAAQSKANQEQHSRYTPEALTYRVSVVRA